DGLRPGGELAPRPLEAVVSVAKGPGLQPLELFVVFPIRRGHDHGAGPRELEEHTLERLEARGIEVLDDLDYRRRIEALDPRVAVRERPVDQPDPLPLPGRQTVQAEPLPRDLERADRDVHPEDFLELPIVQEDPEQPSLAATEIDDAPCPARAQRGHDGA